VLAQGYSSTGTMQWNTSGAGPGVYQVAVWLRDAGSVGLNGNTVGRWDAYALTQYTLVVRPCSAASLSMAPGSSARAGASVTATAVASGCPNPLYQFWVLTPGASAWQLAQGYSTNATLNWNTTAAPPGAYQLAVWVRDSNSAGTAGNGSGRWDAYSTARYNLS